VPITILWLLNVTEVIGQCLLLSYDYWMLQRTLDSVCYYPMTIECYRGHWTVPSTILWLLNVTEEDIGQCLLLSYDYWMLQRTLGSAYFYPLTIECYRGHWTVPVTILWLLNVTEDIGQCLVLSYDYWMLQRTLDSA